MGKHNIELLIYHFLAIDVILRLDLSKLVVVSCCHLLTTGIVMLRLHISKMVVISCRHFSTTDIILYLDFSKLVPGGRHMPPLLDYRCHSHSGR